MDDVVSMIRQALPSEEAMRARGTARPARLAYFEILAQSEYGSMSGSTVSTRHRVYMCALAAMSSRATRPVSAVCTR